jgi:heat shock protein HslJ
MGILWLVENVWRNEMKPKAFYCVGIVIVSCLFGCTASQNTQQNQEEKQVRIHAGNLDRITGMQWILKSIKQDGHDYPLAGENPFIKFEKDKKVSGFASVNRYFGSVQVDS